VSFADRARSYVEERLPQVEPHSAEEMFLRLLEHGAEARAAGNYGIAAAYVVRAHGTELVCFGENSVFSECDPAGHAEMNSLRLARRLATADDGDRERLLDDPRCTLVRAAPHDGFETLLYSTLEPCPMCTVGIINAGVERVFVAQADPPAGALMHLDALPPIWSDFARLRGLRVTAVSEDPNGPARVPKKLVDLLNRLFLDGKDVLDRRLNAEPALPVDRLGSVAHAWRRAHRPLH
jgi:tRNA(Arg) A34 adenosine deaminase TadA